MATSAIEVDGICRSENFTTQDIFFSFLTCTYQKFALCANCNTKGNYFFVFLEEKKKPSYLPGKYRWTVNLRYFIEIYILYMFSFLFFSFPGQIPKSKIKYLYIM